MTKVRVKATPGEKEETHKKKTSTKKKAETGSWPCKINGCNKVFAREADLKRHQRTTKLHSQPGFACPQCDATFTRTDALRRHQKSRHNGVIIEPSDQDKDKRGGDGESAGSKSPRSRDGTPSRREGELATPNGTPPSALAQPATAGPSSGPSGYYRQHTLTAGYPPRHPAGMMIDPHYQSIGIPTSATRMHQSWPHPPWPTGPDGQPLPPNALYVPPPYYHQPSPYYRHPGMMPHMPPPPHGHPYPLPGPDYVPPPHAPNGNTLPPIDPAHQSSQNAATNGKQKEGADEVQRDDEYTESQRASSPPVIDPSLDKPSRATDSAGKMATDEKPSPEESLKTAQAALEAVLKYEEERKSRQASVASEAREGGAEKPAERESKKPDESDDKVKAEEAANSESKNATVAPQMTDQEQIEQILTEDGEPMLNPAELLTQESLASPPP